MALLENKVSIVTGGAVGIGRASALIFAREGAKVVVADIMTGEGEETVRLVQETGGEAVFVRCDVSQAADVEALVQHAVATYGRLDCAFNNAGIEGDVAPTADCTEENWDRIVAVNLKGVWLCMKYQIQQMLAQGDGGTIVNTSSVAGVVAERGFPAYAAAKGGVIQLTRTAAAEYAGLGIRVNAVCPGVINTPMIDRAWAKVNIDAMAPGAVRSPFARKIANKIIRTRAVRKMMFTMMQPMGRNGDPEEIAEAAMWLCSGASSYITGHALLADGGMTVI